MRKEQPGFASRAGDDGTTALGTVLRVEKNSPYIQAIGLADEVNCLIGMVIAAGCGAEEEVMLADVQADMLHLSAELSRPGTVFLTHDRVQRIERQLEHFSIELPAVIGCVVPVGTMAAVMCFKARATCRTLEREIVGLEQGDPEGCGESVRIPYLNRLGDLLFALARTINRRSNAEVISELPAMRASL